MITLAAKMRCQPEGKFIKKISASSHMPPFFCLKWHFLFLHCCCMCVCSKKNKKRCYDVGAEGLAMGCVCRQGMGCHVCWPEMCQKCPGWSAHAHGSLHLKDMYLWIYTYLVLHRHHPRKGSELEEPQSRSNLAIPTCPLLTSHY